ncbi:hypothetical protein ACFFSW_03835 [Saccharothrix longispora]|uniref:Uncharacterized protein n=1 Tax=Saccharothrix longispora TaxID=33920 RepID=A0ABU1PNA1_9PSEU|nr:hypothetical protein [Saccharothrix longispora]MDR6592132.1 hypothetical protein [Saccharothrix longispora]
MDTGRAFARVPPLDPDDVTRLPDRSPSRFSPATREKRTAPAHFPTTLDHFGLSFTTRR